MVWYTGDLVYDTLLGAALVLALLVFVASWIIPSPYGRFASARYGLRLSPRLGWFLMELPSTVSFLIFYFLGPRRFELVPLVFLAVWLIHYGNRGFAFPFLIRSAKGQQASFSFFVIAFGWLVTSLHGYFFASYFTRLGHYTTTWLTDPRFLVGIALYLASYLLNLQSDHIIRRLRSPEEIAGGVHEYRIPRGGLFRWVTNASYLTELGAWAGLALATWSLAGVFILLISAANLVPRAFATHRWYRARFADYPPERKVLIPYLL